MDEPSLGETLAAWLPLLVILAVFFFWARTAKKQYQRHIDEVNGVNQQIVDTNRDMIVELQEIKQILKDQNR